VTDTTQVVHVVPRTVSHPDRLNQAVRSICELFQTERVTMVVFATEAVAYPNLHWLEVNALKAEDAEPEVGNGDNMVAGIRLALKLVSSSQAQAVIIAVHADPDIEIDWTALDNQMTFAGDRIRFVFFEQAPENGLRTSPAKAVTVPAHITLTSEIAQLLA